MRILLPLAVLTLIAFFITGAVAPRKSRRLERWVDDRLEKGEEHGARRAGRLGDWTAKALDLCRRASDKALELGRRLRGAASSTDA